jgi:hypothetical protein
MADIWQESVMSLFVYMITNESNFYVGLLTGITGATQIVSAPLIAVCCEKISRVVILKVASGVGMLAVIFTIIAVSLSKYYILLSCMIIWGLFWSCVNPAMDALIADSVDKGSRSRVYIWRYSMVILGSAAGPTVSLTMFATLGNDWKLNECKFVILLGLVLFFIPLIILTQFESTSSSSSITTDHSANKDSAESVSTVNLEMKPMMLSSESIESGKSLFSTPVSMNKFASLHSEDVEEVDEEGDIAEQDDISPHIECTEESIDETDKIKLMNYEMQPLKQTNSTSSIEKSQSLQVPETTLDSATDISSGYILCYNIPLTPAVIAFGDIVSGLASGMTIKFFPIFFMKNLHMKPMEISLLYMV